MVLRCHTESCIPSIHIAHDTVDPKLLWGMRIRGQLRAQFILANFAPAELCPSKKDALIPRKIIHCKWGVILEREMVGIQSDIQTAKIRNSPALSNALPLVSNPCVSSCPITAPTAP